MWTIYVQAALVIRGVTFLTSPKPWTTREHGLGLMSSNLYKMFEIPKIMKGKTTNFGLKNETANNKPSKSEGCLYIFFVVVNKTMNENIKKNIC